MGWTQIYPQRQRASYPARAYLSKGGGVVTTVPSVLEDPKDKERMGSQFQSRLQVPRHGKV